MHIQTFGLDGSYHIDNIGKKKYTFCLYISDLSNEESEESDGNFLVQLPGKKYPIIHIEVLHNRGLLFPSEWIHKGMAYNHLFGEKRLCLTWKLEEL